MSGGSVSLVSRYNSLFFQSFSTNDFGLFIGPTDLSSTNVWSLNTAGLEKCFDSPVVEGLEIPLRWHDFASDIPQATYEMPNLQKCTCFRRQAAEKSGIRTLVLLADNLQCKVVPISE
jgi:hypothetical protein